METTDYEQFIYNAHEGLCVNCGLISQKNYLLTCGHFICTRCLVPCKKNYCKLCYAFGGYKQVFGIEASCEDSTKAPSVANIYFRVGVIEQRLRQETSELQRLQEEQRIARTQLEEQETALTYKIADAQNLQAAYANAYEKTLDAARRIEILRRLRSKISQQIVSAQALDAAVEMDARNYK